MCLAVCKPVICLPFLPLDLLQSPAPASSGPCQFNHIARTVCNNTQTIFCCVNLKILEARYYLHAACRTSATNAYVLELHLRISEQ